MKKLSIIFVLVFAGCYLPEYIGPKPIVSVQRTVQPSITIEYLHHRRENDRHYFHFDPISNSIDELKEYKAQLEFALQQIEELERQLIIRENTTE